MRPHNYAVSADLECRYPFLSLLKPLGGVVRSVQGLFSQEMHVPRFHSFIAGLGNLAMAYPHIADYDNSQSTGVELIGCGADEDLDLALIRAVAEAAERYSMCIFDKRDIVLGSFDEVGEQGIAWADIPQCSAEEYADPRCPLKPIDPRAPIRWVHGYSIVERRRKLVPMVMTHLYSRLWPSEAFWLPISTGVAAHTSFAQAAVSAICEVIERDAIALTWLLQLPLKRVWLDSPVPDAHSEKFSRLNDSGLRQLFYDASLDIGIPTIYGLQLKDGHPQAAQFVNCSTDFSAWASCAKMVRESAMGRTILEVGLKIPEDYRDFNQLEHGAVYMGQAAQRDAFSFLIDQTAAVPVSQLEPAQAMTPAHQLEYLVSRFKALGMDIVLVELTTDELRDAGLRVIRAVIPGLVPMSACYRARYLGHPRLLEFQAKYREQGAISGVINPYPQPFA